MKRALLISALLTLCTLCVVAQNVVIGNRVPELKVSTWLADRQPAHAPLTFIEFHHPSDQNSRASLDHLRELTGKMDAKLHVIVVSADASDATVARLTGYLSPRMSVGIDDGNRSFTAFGVRYVPFGVLVDARNRALWMGKAQQLTPAFIDKITR